MVAEEPILTKEEHCGCCGEWRPCTCDKGECPNDPGRRTDG